MHYGVYVPNFGAFSDPRLLVAVAREAELAGWDGFFLYDHIVGDAHGCRPGDGLVDPCVALSAIAGATDRIRFGPMVTALARRRPWKVARELVSLDHLSQGRVIFGVGLGGESAFESFGEDPDPKVRAAKLDEGLELIVQFWTGSPVHHDGKHFHVKGAQLLPRPVQTPRIPIWVAGVWPNRAPFERAARWDGVFPLTRKSPLPAPSEIREMASVIRQHRKVSTAYDFVVAGITDAPTQCDPVRIVAEAGATWWLEWLEADRGSIKDLRDRVQAGPPRIETA